MVDVLQSPTGGSILWRRWILVLDPGVDLPLGRGGGSGVGFLEPV